MKGGGAAAAGKSFDGRAHGSLGGRRPLHQTPAGPQEVRLRGKGCSSGPAEKMNRRQKRGVSWKNN